jgi:hypothetical protein
MHELDRNNFEIIIVGGGGEKYFLDENTQVDYRHIPFDNSPRITVKKNLITENATKENIVFLHDYFGFDDQWYQGYLEFGDHWDICMNIILNTDGSRFRDWVTWDAPENQDINGKTGLLAPYSYDKQEYMYISGGYWVAKKSVMEKEPLNKWLQQCECEDLEWSKRVLRKGYKYKMNTMSVNYVLKPYKATAFKYMPE